MKKRVFTFLISYIVSFFDFQNFSFLQRTEVYYYPHMPIGKVWIYRLLFVCVFVCVCVCTVTDFSTKDKANGVKLCSPVHRRPRQEISHFGELCSHRSPKSDESAWPARWPIRPIELRRSWNIARRVIGVWT